MPSPRGVTSLHGLVGPRQISTGDRTILGKISKRSHYLRVLFVQAAWVVLVEPLMRFMRGDVRPYRFIQNRSRTSVVALNARQQQKSPKITFREIFRVVRFSAFATISHHEWTSSVLRPRATHHRDRRVGCRDGELQNSETPGKIIADLQASRLEFVERLADQRGLRREFASACNPRCKASSSASLAGARS